MTQIPNSFTPPTIATDMDRSTPNRMAVKSRIAGIDEEIEALQLQLTRRSKTYFDSSFSQWRLSNKLQTDEELYEAFVTRLKEEFTRVYALAGEANTITLEMQRHVIYTVILHTPVIYLKPNERTIDHLCEPAVQVNPAGFAPQLWSVEKFEHKLSQMRDVCQRWRASSSNGDSLKRHNPFYDQEPESLIGVANIHLKALFFNSKLDYVVSIINSKGQTSGSLHVVLDHTGSFTMKHASDLQSNRTTCGSISEGICVDVDEGSLSNHSTSQYSSDDEGIEEAPTIFDDKNEQIKVKFAINEARDLPAFDAEQVVCRYNFINPKLDQTAVSIKRSDEKKGEQKSTTFSFDHEMEYTFPITDAFRSTCLTKFISVEVWSQTKLPLSPAVNPSDASDHQQYMAKTLDLSKRWKDVKRNLELIVEIHELNTSGQWKPVQVDAHDGILSGGIYRLKQGQSKHLVVQLRAIPRSNAMALSIYAIRSVEIGSISTRKMDAPLQLDSYQDKDLFIVKQQWLSLIEKRKLLVESQFKTLSQQTDKTDSDIHKENFLLNEILQLAKEQDVAVLPPQSSGIPGAPAGWNPPPEVEIHRPLIFLNLDPFKLTLSNETAGLEATLSGEDPNMMITLPLIQNASDKAHAVALWNPTIHESPLINQVTANGTVVYLIVKITVMINEPVQMELVLRKRIAVTISKSDGWWSGKPFKNFLGYETYTRTTVLYEVVSNVPKSLHTVEDQTRLDVECLSRENIEKHILSASAIDSVLLLDRMRQDVLLAENFATQRTPGKPTSALDISSRKRKKNATGSPATNHPEQSHQEKTPLINDSELYSSTPSIVSRRSYIEDQQIAPVGTPPPFEVKHTIVLDDDQPKADSAEIPLEEKYPITASQSASSLSKLAADDATDEYAVGSRVIINTGHSIVEKPGIVRYIDKINEMPGIWYGVELEEPLGKNNGSLNGRVYFQCADNHGVFVRREKLKRVPT